MRPIIVLRPEPGTTKTVQRARELGLDARPLPLFSIEPLEWRAPEASGFDALLLTSANAVRQGGDQLEKLRGLQVYAVGDATADAAREAGFDIAAAGDADIDSLLSSIPGELRLLHLCGADRRVPDRPRQHIRPLPVYSSHELERPELADLGPAVALIHSPRAGRRLAELVPDKSRIAIAAISAAAADAAGAAWEAVEIAERPNDDALLALAARLCNKPSPL